MERILPSYPLFVKDPYFSFWANGEELNKCDTMIWTGEKKGLYGVIEIDGKEFCFMGAVRENKYIPQTSLNVTTYTTDYTFENEYALLKVSFVSPLPIDDYKMLSCPVCYMKYEVTLKQGKEFSIKLALNGNICYNDIGENNNKTLRGGAFPLEKFETAYMGLMRQSPLSHVGDEDQANWGYFYVTGEKATYTDKPFNSLRIQPFSSNMYIVGECHALSGNILVGFDDEISIAYFGDYLKGYYFEDGKTILDALNETYENIEAIDKKLAKEDLDWKNQSARFGEDYYKLVYASYRQVMAGHKLVKDTDGNILFLSKECGSNGCIGTVDISYPSMPLFLLKNTELLKGMMRPIFKFAKMPVWQYDFAPHDVGTYPICGGQVYGLLTDAPFSNKLPFSVHADVYKFPKTVNAFKFEMQMPVEESANMIIMAYGCYFYDKDLSFLQQNIDLMEKWVKYLEKYGLKPENQLCTDDFAGHLANNVNLTIKATVAIMCYAKILSALGKDGSHYEAVAKDFAKEVTKFAKKYSHIPLTWESDDTTFSLKYNFAFDKVFGFHLFEQELFEKEVDCYLERLGNFGTPLDTRANYTKSDWLLWCATLTDSEAKREKIIHSVANFLTGSLFRLPFSDWYDVTDGARHRFGDDRYPCPVSFRNRTVQGGLYILFLLK